MGELFVTTCPEGRCQAVGLGGWTGEFDVYHSIDGGMSWSAAGHVPAMSFPDVVDAGSVLMGQLLGRDANDEANYRFFSFPSGEPVQPPAPNTMPRLVPGVGLVWEPSWQPSGQFGAEATYDSSGHAMTNLQITPNLQAHLLGKANDGALYVGMGLRAGSPGGPASAHALHRPPGQGWQAHGHLFIGCA